MRADEERMAGDVVLYWTTPRSGSKSWLHVARVAEVRELGTVRILWVVSKWGDAGGEWLHRFDDVPYERDGVCPTYEFWTDRPRT
jgi:hypothetical protein